MSEVDSGFSWVDDPEDDGLDLSSIKTLALRYYSQWRAGRLDPAEPISVELLLAAEHILSDIRKRSAAAMLCAATVKLPLPAERAQSPVAENTVYLSDAAIDTGEESKT